MDARISTRWVRPETKGEVNNGKELVDKAAYIPTEKRINALMQAGRDLVQWRRDQFDAGPDDEDFEPDIDPTRKPGVDITDVQAYGATLKERMEKRNAEREKAAFEAAQKKADMGSGKETGSNGDPAGSYGEGNKGASAKT